MPKMCMWLSGEEFFFGPEESFFLRASLLMGRARAVTSAPGQRVAKSRMD